MGQAAIEADAEGERQRRIREAIAAVNAAYDYGDGSPANTLLTERSGLMDQAHTLAQAQRSWDFARNPKGTTIMQRIAAIDAQLAALPKAGRSGYYDEVETAIRDKLMLDLNEQGEKARSAIAARLAASGLTGGSVDVASRADLEKALLRGTEQLTSQAATSRAALRSSDEGARNELIGLAMSGLSATDASERAASRASGDLETARAQTNLANIGDVFSSLLDQYGVYNTGVQQGQINENIRRGNYSLPSVGGGSSRYSGNLTG